MPDAEDPFAGTAAAYARSRPGYGDDALDHLDERFGLDGARVLDLGCGAGQLAVPLAERGADVIAMDPNEAMLRATRERAERAATSTVETVAGSDADLRAGLLAENEPIELATMGRSFHWMDERATLDALREATTPGGGVAILDDVEWLTGGEPAWTASVYEVGEEFLDDLPERYDPESVEYDDPWGELLVDRGFEAVEVATFPVEREWTVDRIVDYVFSLSFASPEHFGDEQAAFEAALRERLAEEGGGLFAQTATVEVVSGRAPE